MNTTLNERGVGHRTSLFNQDGNKLADYTNETGVVIKGKDYQKGYIPIPVLKNNLRLFNSYNNNVVNYQTNNPESKNVQKHLLTKPPTDHDRDIFGFSDAQKAKQKEEETLIPINDIIRGVY